jgi:cobalamin-dependent methionine synthase I
MLIVGEKLNSSIKKVAEAIAARDVTFVQDLAKRQTAAGSGYLDVNAAIRGPLELEDLTWLIETVHPCTETPICVDSPNPAAIELGLKLLKKLGHAGRPMVNSITGEPEKMNGILPLVAEAKCPVVALTNDEEGIPMSVDDRLRIAGKIVKAAEGFGIPLDDIYFDPLVLPVSTDCNNGKIFMETVRRIKAEWPGVHTISGLSNISYGLPKRKIVNRTFLVMAMAAGMDAAIMDPLDLDIMALLKAGELLLGQDDFCMNYLMAFRAGLFGA